MDRWLSFAGITIISNEPRSGLEPHFVRLNGKLYSRITCTGQKTRNVVHNEFFFFFFFFFDWKGYD